MKKKILVTGGGGYIGRHVIAALDKLGAEVYVADPNYPADRKHHKVTVPIFSGEKDIFRKMGSPDVLVHLAWQDGFRHDAESHIENLPQHHHFLQAMMAGGLKQIVGMGSMHEIGYHEGAVSEKTAANPMSLYGVAKNSLRQITELLAHHHGTIYQWVRGFYIVGDDLRNQSVFKKILEAEKRGDPVFPFVHGEKQYDFIDVKELGKQIAAVANQTKITGIINCCSGQPRSLAEQADQFIKDNKLKIRLDYGAFPDRPYDSPMLWGDDTKIRQILAKT
jgi:dTDP-6-deoxy-L-talose 4-dehydrogenase (NAD+)